MLLDFKNLVMLLFYITICDRCNGMKLNVRKGNYIVLTWVYKIRNRLVKTQQNYSLFSTICTVRTNNYMFQPILGHLQVASFSLGRIYLY
jgi:hypothetical protein